VADVGSYEDDKEKIKEIIDAKSSDNIPSWWPLGFYKAVARMVWRLLATKTDHAERIRVLEERVEFLTPAEYRDDD
jgi:hypothetical protein